MRTLIDQENDQGYVLIDKIIGSKKKMIMNKAKKIDIVEIAEYSQIFELDPEKNKIRRKTQTQLFSKELTMLGLDKNGIRNLSPKQLTQFMRVKDETED